jgi:predicted ATP-dependent endonuclease of OLD family
MIKSLSINNFRVFQSESDFEMAPITILTGANNSGKSTLIRSIKLLVESAKNSSLLYLLNSKTETDYLSSDTIFSLGNDSKEISLKLNMDLEFIDIFDDNKMKFVLGCPQDCIVNIKYKTEGENSDHLKLDRLEIILNGHNDIILEIKQKDVNYEFNEDEYKHLNTSRKEYHCYINPDYYLDCYPERSLEALANSFAKKYHIDKETLDKLSLKIKEDFIKQSKSSQFPDLEYSALNIDNQRDLVEIIDNWQGELYRNILPDSEGTTYNAYLKFLQELFGNNIHEKDIELMANKIASGIESALNHYDKHAKKIIKSLVDSILLYDYYIPVYRGKVERDFMRNNSSRISDIIFKLIDKKKEVHSHPDKVFWRENYIDCSDMKRLQFVNAILKYVYKLDFFILFEFNKHKSKYEIYFEYDPQSKPANSLQEHNANNKINLADMGTGMYHLIIFLIEIELAIIEGGFKDLYDSLDSELTSISHKAKSSLLIEEPELSLHPNYQSLLADVIDIANKVYGVNFIIETHSEYLIRKLQLLRAKSNLSQEDVLIYNFGRINNRLISNKIQINNDGSLTKDFIPGFFDEADKIALNLFLLKKHQTN